MIDKNNNDTPNLSRVLKILTVIVFACGIAFGQAVSQISGSVTDPTGAAVPEVQVTATQTDTGVKRTAETDATGSYVLTDLPLGPYRLEASKAGFRSYAQNGIVLQVNSNPEIPIVLNLGQVSETVEVSANATAVETRSMGVGSVVGNQEVLDLPLNGRVLTDLIPLAGAAIRGITSPTYGFPSGVQISVAGGQGYGVGYFLDGAMQNNPFDGTGIALPFPDAMQEFKVDTGALTAQYGKRAGAAVNAVTKSGTNSLHGDLFEFIRNAVLDGKDPISHTNDFLKRNQYGGTIGGPIKKDKLFFFAGYQGTLIRQSPSNTATFVPTTAMLNGDFTAYMANGCAGSLKTLSAPFVNNQIPASMVSPVAIAIAAKLPTGSGPCGSTFFGNPVHENDYQYIGKVDYQLNEKHSLFGRYLATAIRALTPYALDNNLLSTSATPGEPYGGNGQNDLATSVALGDTYLFNPNTVNLFRVAMNRLAGNITAPGFFTPQQIGINAYSNVPDSSSVTVTGGFAFGGITPSQQFSTIGSANDDLSLTRGSHQFGFGATFDHIKTVAYTGARSNNPMTSQGTVTGNPFGDFIIGDVELLTNQAISQFEAVQNFFGLYAQDTWKVSRRFTLNYGLRWDPYFPNQALNGRLAAFSLTAFDQGIVSKIYPNAAAGVSYPGDPGFVNGSAGVNKQWNLVTPRIGFAWDPKGDGRTAIRGGAGIANDVGAQDMTYIAINVSPWGCRTDSSVVMPIANPYSVIPGGNIYPCVPGTFVPFSSNEAVQSNLKTPQMYSWTLAVQRQVTNALFASASYIGNQSIHLLGQQEGNVPVNIPGLPYLPSSNPLCAQGVTTPGPIAANCLSNENQRRTLYLQNPILAQNVGPLGLFNSVGTQLYNGLLMSTAWKPSRLVNINANYTWSHCIGDPNFGGTVSSTGDVYTPGETSRNYDRGNCAFDVRDNFNLTAVAQTPRFDNAITRLLASNWTTSVILHLQSGDALAIRSGLDNALQGAGYLTNLQRPNQILPNPYSNSGGGQWLNPAAFTQPALGTYGNVANYDVYGPDHWQFDMSLTRAFQIREGQRFELRVDAFNILNKFQWADPSTTTLSAGTFGKMLSDVQPSGVGARVMQFAAKYVF